ncbi:MAG TPA: hypothetical protein VFX19_14600 [Dehalococcoidia bacterium]|jgi:dipeptidyl aminopeptidase/acylaminoacyl peptidase|nr:hypothetical protein [Dehalococcoidia bacterium]
MMLIVVSACGDNGSSPSGSAQTAVPEATTEPTTPAATATATVVPSSPIALKPVLVEEIRQPILFDTHGPGPVTMGGVPMPAWPFFQAHPFWRTTTWDLALYDARTQQWQQLDLGEMPGEPVVSADGARAAVTARGRLTLLDLGSLTSRPLDVAGDAVSWSPDGRRLAVRLRNVNEGESPFVIVTPEAGPSSVQRLPLGSTRSIAQFGLTWLDNDSVLLISQKSNLVQVYDVSGQTPAITLEQAVESDQIGVSPDGRRVAVGITHPDRSFAVALYDIRPFKQIDIIEGASLGNQLAVPRWVWNSDASRLLVVRDMCEEAERLVMVNVADMTEIELARAGIMQFVFAPNGVWVAFTAWPRSAYVVMAQPGAKPFFAADEVSAPSTPVWSPDSRYATFSPYTGGYDRCFV